MSGTCPISNSNLPFCLLTRLVPRTFPDLLTLFVVYDWLASFFSDTAHSRRFHSDSFDRVSLVRFGFEGPAGRVLTLACSKRGNSGLRATQTGGLLWPVVSITRWWMAIIIITFFFIIYVNTDNPRCRSNFNAKSCRFRGKEKIIFYDARSQMVKKCVNYDASQSCIVLCSCTTRQIK